VAKRENSKVETSQVVADAIAVKTMGDRIREASRCSHALLRGGSAVSVGTESGGCGSVELVASHPETGHGDNAGTEFAPKAPPMLTTPATVPSDLGVVSLLSISVLCVSRNFITRDKCVLCVFPGRFRLEPAQGNAILPSLI
jgi:hypothetical protein